MDGGKVGDERQQSLQNSELYINSLAHTIIHGIYDCWYGGLRNRFESDKSLERTQRYRDDFRILRGAPHEHRFEQVF